MAVRSWVAAVAVAAMAVTGQVLAAPAGAAPERTPLVRGPVEHLVGTAGGGSAWPVVAVDDEGTATAVWRQAYRAADGTAKYRIRAARRGIGGRWSTPRTIGCHISCPGAFPRVGVDATGAVTAAWITRTTVTVARRPAAGPWHAPRVIATSTAALPQGSLNMAVARNGAVFAVWNAHWGAGVWAAHRTTGGIWQAPVLLVGAKAEVVWRRPSVGVSATGAAVVTFQDGAVRAARFVPGHGWGSSRWLGDWGDEIGPRVAVGRTGRALVVWTPGGDTEETWWVHAREMSPSGVWGPVRIISARTRWSIDEDHVPVIDSSGTETVAYDHRSQTHPDVGMVARKPVGGTWTRTSVVTRAVTYGSAQLVVNRRNDLAVAFGALVLRPHGSSWSAPAPGRGVIAILPGGSALRMWWTTSGLVAQRLHLP